MGCGSSKQDQVDEKKAPKKKPEEAAKKQDPGKNEDKKDDAKKDDAAKKSEKEREEEDVGFVNAGSEDDDEVEFGGFDLDDIDVDLELDEEELLNDDENLEDVCDQLTILFLRDDVDLSGMIHVATVSAWLADDDLYYPHPLVENLDCDSDGKVSLLDLHTAIRGTTDIPDMRVPVDAYIGRANALACRHTGALTARDVIGWVWEDRLSIPGWWPLEEEDIWVHKLLVNGMEEAVSVDLIESIVAVELTAVQARRETVKWFCHADQDSSGSLTPHELVAAVDVIPPDFRDKDEKQLARFFGGDDGKMTLSEILVALDSLYDAHLERAAFISQLFTEADLNGDGYLCREELSKFQTEDWVEVMPELVGKSTDNLMQMFDPDGDSVITKADVVYVLDALAAKRPSPTVGGEISPAAAQATIAFHRADRDNSGTLCVDEIVKMIEEGALSALGLDGAEAGVVLKVLDKDDSGTVTLVELIVVVVAQQEAS